MCKPIHRMEIVSEQSFLELVKDTWSTESFGCKYNLSEVRSFEDRKAEAILDKQVFHNGQRWVTPILRQDLTEIFPASYEMAKKRTLMFERRLDRSEKELEQI